MIGRGAAKQIAKKKMKLNHANFGFFFGINIYILLFNYLNQTIKRRRSTTSHFFYLFMISKTHTPYYLFNKVLQSSIILLTKVIYVMN